METIVIVLIISMIINLVLTYACWNSIKKIETYEEDRIRIFVLINKLLSDLREIDNQQMFEKDDEVGTIFTQPKEMIQFYYKLISGNTTIYDENEKEKE